MVISPVLANLFLNYTFDDFIVKQFPTIPWEKYADDGVTHCTSLKQAKYLQRRLEERFKQCELELNLEKTMYGVLRYIKGCLIKWIRRKYKKQKHRRKAEYWLGSIAKRDVKLFAHWKFGVLPAEVFMKTIISKIYGHCRYYGITDNRRSVGNFIDECRSLIFKCINRRSQKRSFDWNKFAIFLKKYPLPKVKTYVNIFELGAGSSYLL